VQSWQGEVFGLNSEPQTPANFKCWAYLKDTAPNMFMA
jgi:hypothetical protein